MILRICIQVFSGIFLLVNAHPLKAQHHTTIMLYTLVRMSEGITSVLSALGFLNPGLHLMQTLFIF